MNNIPLIKPYKKDWLVQKEKFNRYKICNVRKFYPAKSKWADGKAFRSSDGKAIFVYDFGDCLSISRINYSFIKYTSEKPTFTTSGTSNIYKVKFKNGRINIWEISIKDNVKKIRNISNKLGRIEQNVFKLKKIHPVYQKRLNSIIKHFLRRHKIKFKYSTSYLENLSKACYPGIRDFKLDNFDFHSIYSRYLRNRSIKYTIKKCFGHDSKKLTKIICEKIQKDKLMNIFVNGRAFKGLLPLDYFYKILESENFNQHYLSSHINNYSFKLQNIRKLLKNFNSQRLLKLILSPDFTNHNFEDSVRLYPNFTGNLPKQPKNWAEIHNIIAPIRNIPARDWARNYPAPQFEHFDLPVRKSYEKIDNLEIDNFKFEVPKNTKDLFRYSDELNNCIRNYGNQIKDNYCNILAVYKDNKLTYNISVQNREIDQFKAKFNENPPNEDRNKILDILQNKGIIRRLEMKDLNNLYQNVRQINNENAILV